MTIYKFEISFLWGVESIWMPKTAVIMKAALREDRIEFWADCEPLEDYCFRNYHKVYTGDEIPYETTYIDTFRLDDIVIHLFEGWT